MGYDREYWKPGDLDPFDFTWDTDCTDPNDSCDYQESHQHGFACDKSCPCRTEEHLWRDREKKSAEVV